jgi:hypothetical protein
MAKIQKVTTLYLNQKHVKMITRNKYDTTNIVGWVLTNRSPTNELAYSIHPPPTTTCTV